MRITIRLINDYVTLITKGSYHEFEIQVLCHEFENYRIIYSCHDSWPFNTNLRYKFFVTNLRIIELDNLITILVICPELSNLRISIFHKKSRKQELSSRYSVGPKTKFENSIIRDNESSEKQFDNSQIRDNESSEKQFDNSQIRDNEASENNSIIR